MPSSIKRWSPNLLPRLPLSDGISDSTTAQNSSEITPIRVIGQSSLINAFPFGRHALVGDRQRGAAGRSGSPPEDLVGDRQRRAAGRRGSPPEDLVGDRQRRAA